ncbi:tetratricopeptide repeat protein [Spirosoma sp.]|uniref:tetratricopeptide repeat protein n=1 Tax=Spirosoma sp. TaxID=1899569 RepID=UPI002610AC33|nr:tetratricopeptide repeat protein [Spirosoma sp.]MCX6214602.1 tetratricopeptide repeat protein [Spirosoma sp.]
MAYPTRYWFILVLLGSIGGSSVSLAQELTIRDNDEVKLLARRKVERGLNDLLNVLSLTDLGEAERNALINESFSPGVNQLFADKDVIVEDDISPSRAAVGTVLDVSVEKYLANFDLLYAKASQSSIQFSGITVSDLKKGNSLYVKVFYTSFFSGKHTKIDKPYVPVRRVAEVRADRAGTKWAVLITRLAFMTQADSTNRLLNNVPLKEAAPRQLTAATDSLKNGKDSAQLVAIAPVDPEREREEALLEAYQKLLGEGEKAFAANDLETALQRYEQAEKQKPFEDLTPKLRMFRIQRVLEERARNSMTEMRKRADLALRKRRYAEALALMQRLSDLQPDSVNLTGQIKELIVKARRKAELDERFSAGQYRELLKDYNRLIEEDRKQNKTPGNNANSSDWYLGRGKCYTQLREYKDALKDLNESIRLDFQNLDALESRADLYARMGDFPKAAADLSVYLTVDPTNPDLRARRATYRIRTNRIAEAFADYNEAIRISDQKPLYYQLRGVLYQQTGLCEKAAADFTEGINRSRRQPMLYFHRGYAQVCLKQYALAGADFARSIELGLDAATRSRIDSLAEAFYAQSEQVLQSRKLPEALTLLSIALTIKPDYADAWLAKGKIHAGRGETNEADSALTNAIRYNPTNALSFYQRGLTKLRKAAYAEAVDDFNQSLTLLPTSYEAALGEAKARMALHQYDKAQGILSTVRNLRRQLERRYPPTFFAETYYLSGKCAYALRQYDDALDQFEEALSVAKDWASAYAERGRTYEAIGKPDRARDDYNKAVQLEPTVAAHYLPLALMIEHREKYEDALKEYTHCQEVDRDHLLANVVALGKGRCLMALGKYLEALSELNKVGQYDGVACTDECFYLRTYAQVRTGQLPMNTRLAGFSTTNVSPENAPKIQYVLACAHLQANDDSKALAQLEKALQMGIPKEFLKKDRLLDFVRKDFRKTAAYQQLINRYRP